GPVPDRRPSGARRPRGHGDSAARVAAGPAGRSALRTAAARRRAPGGAGVAVIEREARIVNPLGLHARPAAELVKVANRFQSAVELRKDDLTVNGKSIMGVMMLAAECGASLFIKTDGADATEAMEALLALVADGFHEMEPPADAAAEETEDQETPETP